MIAFGVFAGTRMPYHCDVSKSPVFSQRPSGTFGNETMRSCEPTASARSLPALICPHQCRGASEGRLHATAKDVLQHRSGPFVRHVGGL